MAGDLYIKCFKCFHKFKMALENMTHFFIYAGYSWHVLGCDLETPISQKGLDRFALNSRKLRTTCHMRWWDQPEKRCFRSSKNGLEAGGARAASQCPVDGQPDTSAPPPAEINKILSFLTRIGGTKCTTFTVAFLHSFSCLFSGCHTVKNNFLSRHFCGFPGSAALLHHSLAQPGTALLFPLRYTG